MRLVVVRLNIWHLIYVRNVGVVLRVDSPGGSALASDVIWRAIRKVSREKPVVASMVDVAASGGYYLSMACDQIFAEELTITGSIVRHFFILNFLYFFLSIVAIILIFLRFRVW